MPNHGLNLELEALHRSDTDWVFGAASLPSIVAIPPAERSNWLPVGEVQKGAEDTMDCASRGPTNVLEAIFTYHYTHAMKPENKAWLLEQGYVANNKVTFSDAFTAILSGTTSSGNSLIAPLDSLHNNGLIPKPMLPLLPTMTFAQYIDRDRVTVAMLDLGKEFVSRFTINYDRVFSSDFPSVSQIDFIDIATYAWPAAVNGIYPRTAGSFNHCVAIFMPQYFIFDNYPEGPGDFIKQLAPDYAFYDYGYRVFVSAENVPADASPEPFWAWLPKFLAWLSGGKLGPMPVPPFEITPAETPQQKLLALSESFSNTDPSPTDPVDDILGCADSLTSVIQKQYPSFPKIYGTAQLLKELKTSKFFEETNTVTAGSVIINATGTGNDSIRGHCGIIGQGGSIWSNDSRTGLWTTFYTLDTWRKRYRISGGMPTHIFLPLNSDASSATGSGVR